MLFLSISEGDDPESRRPIIASTDERLIRAVLEHLALRFGTPAASARTAAMRRLRPAVDPSDDDEGGGGR